jgi:hypothetical protein
MAISKAEIRRWLKRVRLNAKEIEELLKEPGPLDTEALEFIHEWSMDLSGCGGEVQELCHKELNPGSEGNDFGDYGP